MMGFSETHTALQSGKQVWRERWDRDSVLFVQGSELMYSCRGNAARIASSDLLDWHDINATDWQVVEPTSTNHLHQTQLC